MNKSNRVELNGIEVYPFTSFKEIIDFADKEKGLLVAVNAEKVTKATNETRNIINSNIGYADGAGVMVAMKRKGHENVIRIPGCELWLEIIKKFQSEKSFYLVGGKQEVIDETVAKLKKDYPLIQLLGYRNGYIKNAQERQELIEDIITKKPDVVFIAMGSPKQELLMSELMSKHQAIYQGLGGSFDVYTGRVKRAPKWWREHNLEFLYRFLKQPQRYKREYYRLKFLFWLVIGKFK
ncbi:MAG: WecB/TagA/CpsF family glycosyltransferase [Prevotella sp.]|nr:WecB/TagA/CpsF family glycosyltransferase [Prevotella sp.]